MRASSNRRSRGGRSGSNGRSGASGGRGSGNNRRSNNSNRSYDSNGPDGKIRGSATQVYEKYMSLGRDAYVSGNPVAAENYYQHAEHYYRIMLANNLVKVTPSQEEENSDDQSNGNNSDNQAQQEEVAIDVKPETKKGEKDEDEQPSEVSEPIIIDLSNPDSDTDNEAPSLQFVDASEEENTDMPADTKEASGDADATDEEKPKTKRRVSRTRGLRRRVTRRGSNSDEGEEKASS